LFGSQDNAVMNEKIVNDTAAYVQSIAELRNRNVEWAISAVRESKSITATRAQELRVIDLIAEDLDDLVAKLNGRRIRMDRDTTVTLLTEGKQVVNLDMSFSQNFLTTLSNPNLVFFLLALGILGLYIEFSNPGLVLPGVVGAISLLMALIAMQTLPISYGALGLVLLGVALLVAEAFVPSFGILGFGGLASLLFGSLFLLDPSRTNLQVSRPMVFGTVGVIGLVALVIGRLLLKSFNVPNRSFQANMVGAAAVVSQAIAPGAPGRVLINGELWRAESRWEVPVGAKVRVVAMEGLLLQVEPDTGSQAGAAGT
jgi:membrane-bound serine protease (ClpP class)